MFCKILLATQLLIVNDSENDRYEEELSHPVQSLLGGELARALLIQVFRPPSFLSFFSRSSHMKYNNTCNCFRVLILKWIFFPVIPRSRKVCVFFFENLSDYDGAGLAIWGQQFGWNCAGFYECWDILNRPCVKCWSHEAQNHILQMLCHLSESFVGFFTGPKTQTWHRNVSAQFSFVFIITGEEVSIGL